MATGSSKQRFSCIPLIPCKQGPNLLSRNEFDAFGAGRGKNAVTVRTESLRAVLRHVGSVSRGSQSTQITTHDTLRYSTDCAFCAQSLCSLSLVAVSSILHLSPFEPVVVSDDECEYNVHLPFLAVLFAKGTTPRWRGETSLLAGVTNHHANPC